MSELPDCLHQREGHCQCRTSHLSTCGLPFPI